MELSEARPFGTEESGRKPTHDFLSLYSHSTAQQDPGPPSQGSYLKTHNFLQPLERVEKKATAKKEATRETSSVAQNPPLPLPAPPPSVEHILPGGTGTYSISHISHFHNNQRVPKPEASLFNDDNPNCSSYTSSGFTLWEESAVKKGKTRKENNVGEKPILGESAAKRGQWTLTEQTSQSLSDNHHCSEPLPSSKTTGQKRKSFIEMMKSAEDCSQHDEGLDNEEAFILSRESSNTQRAELRVQVDGKSTDQNPNTPRSKHSATEQRRRSKINDRFQMLRELIPKSDQKRDKASFLLEVIEYIHFLQEKVHKYEGSFQGWSQEPERLMPWRNNHRPTKSFESRGTNSGSGPSPALLFASKIDEKNICISPATPRSSQNRETGLSNPTAFKAMNQNPGIINKAIPISTSSQPNLFASTQIGGQGVLSQLTPTLTSDAENTIYQPSLQCQTYTCSTEVTAASEKLKEKDVNIEGGGISISSLYSKGLLDTLTQALQRSGVDLSQASLSVQIELGKQAKIRPAVPICGSKDGEVPSSNQGTMRSRIPSSEKFDQAVKGLKTSRS